jgi:hypothetical protein
MPHVHNTVQSPIDCSQSLFKFNPGTWSEAQEPAVGEEVDYLLPKIVACFL